MQSYAPPDPSGAPLSNPSYYDLMYQRGSAPHPLLPQPIPPPHHPPPSSIPPLPPSPYPSYSPQPPPPPAPYPPAPYPDPSALNPWSPSPTPPSLPDTSTSTSDPTAYYAGFHDGTLRLSPFAPGSLASWLAPLAANLLLFLGPVLYMRARMAQAAAKSGAPSSPSALMEMFNPLKSRDFRVDVKGTTFAEVIGIEEAKREVRQYVDFLRHPEKYTKLGGRLPKGCLLTGRPGTGKTLLAKAVAGEAGVPFFCCSGADFIEVFGGSGPKRVRELFAAARAAGKCVVFIDEIDAIGSRSSGRGMGGVSSEENRTINQLLSELDGMQSSENIIVLAATNFPEAIDKALMREGRFDRKVNIPMPDEAARADLFEFYMNRVTTGDPNSKIKVASNAEGSVQNDRNLSEKKVDIAQEVSSNLIVPGVSNKLMSSCLADRTPGVSPAQISTIVNEAALSAAVSEQKYVSLKYFQEAIDDVLIGKKHRQRMGDAALRRTAFHESGHCLTAWLSPLQKDVIKLSIIPRGKAGGYTQQVQDEALNPHTNDFLFSNLCVLAGGRVAEQLIFGDVSTGAMDDLQRATKLAMDKLLLYGMSEAPRELREGKLDETKNPISNKSGTMLSFQYDSTKSEGRGWMPFSESHHAKVETEAKCMVDRAFAYTENLLKQNLSLLTELAERLLKDKELDRDAIIVVLGKRDTVS